MKVDLSQKQSKTITLNKNIQLPNDRYTLRCMSEDFVESKSSGNMMVVRVFEFITESVLAPDGTTIILAGAEITRYYSMASKGTEKKSAEEATAGLLDQFKQDTECIAPGKVDWTQFDTDKPPLVCEGAVFDALCSSTKKQERKPPAPGKKIGDLIMGTDGKPLTTWEPIIKMFLGVSTTQVNQPY